MSPVSPVRRVALLTTKPWPATSLVGFHHLARAFARRGDEVLFLTVHASRLGDWGESLRRGPRAGRADQPGARPGDPRATDCGISVDAPARVAPGEVRGHVWRTLWHPANLRVGALNALARPLFRRYGHLSLGHLEPILAGSHLAVFDSGSDLMLFDRVKALAPGARLAYRVSDDLRHAGVHPVVLEAEAAAAPRFDRISSPCAAIHARFAHLPRARLDHHAVDRALFDRPSPNPYAGQPGRHAVFVGRSFLDRAAIAALADRVPGLTVHVIGNVAGLPRRPNVRAYGERAFADTVPFIRHADVGLHTIEPVAGGETFTDSLKVIQYTYCRLPIVAPAFLRSPRPNVFAYEVGDAAGLARALDAASRFERSSLDVSGIRSWGELAAELDAPG